MRAPDLPELKPKVILGISAHPDDLDWGAGGTIAKLAAEGAAVYYLILTDGSKGSADRNMSAEQLIEMRQAEQQAALALFGGKSVEFLGYADGELEVTRELKRQLVKAIRKIKPDLVITTDPATLYVPERGFINHPDHRAAGQAALDAVFPLARDHLSFPELCAAGYEPHVTPHVLLLTFGAERANFFVDISSHFEEKVRIAQAHISQMPNLAAWLQRYEKLATEQGAKVGSRYAEAFIRLDLPNT